MADTFKDGVEAAADLLATYGDGKAERLCCAGHRFQLEQAIRALSPPSPAQDEREALRRHVLAIVNRVNRCRQACTDDICHCAKLGVDDLGAAGWRRGR